VVKKIFKQKTYKPSFIREWRLERGMTLAQLARAAGTTPTSISRIERGVQPYSQGALESIATALGCRAADLIDRPPGPQDHILKVLATLPPAIQSTAVAMLELLAALNDNGNTTKDSITDAAELSSGNSAHNQAAHRCLAPAKHTRNTPTQNTPEILGIVVTGAKAVAVMEAGGHRR